jgi:hypothetical protein
MVELGKVKGAAMDTSTEVRPSTNSGESTVKSEPASSDPPADPSDKFLKRKARRRAEADAQPKAPQKTMDHRRFYRADTISGAFRAWSFKIGK